MSYDPTLAQKAREGMDARFEELQAVQRRMEVVRQAGMRVEFSLYEEWTRAYERFQVAYEEWKTLRPARLDQRS